MNRNYDRSDTVQEVKNKFGKVLMRLVLPAILFIVFLFVMPFLIGINDGGMRTVIQYPSGGMHVKFSPGVYFQAFGKVTEYTDVATYDFDEDIAATGATVDQKGIKVRFQDGGIGTIFGKARFNLPNDEDMMINIHKSFRSNNGLGYKLLKSVTEEAMTLTAGLMTSEDAYATKRGIFSEYAREQIEKGKFATELVETVIEDETGKATSTMIPVIRKTKDTNLAIHLDSDFKKYGISVDGFQLNNPDFEGSTLKQISAKREATMAIITAKANAERAKQDAITAEEQGRANVITAQYEKEVEKKKAIVVAEQDKEVAKLAAEKLVEIAKQSKFEATEKKLAAVEYKQEQTLRGEGDGAYKRIVMEADGALAQKLNTYERVMSAFATEFAKQKWVPEIQMGSDAKGGNSAADLISLLTAKTVKDLDLDMSNKSKKQ